MYGKTTVALATLLALGSAQHAGTQNTETHPKIAWEKCTAPGECTTVNGELVIDADWRWTPILDTNEYCYMLGSWQEGPCPDGETCAESCAVEGQSYQSTLGISTEGSSVTMKFMHWDGWSTNYGHRLYLLNGEDKYQMFTLNGNEFAFDVDNHDPGCAFNGAVYFVSMDEDGGMSKYPGDKAGPKYGTGYCNARCARDQMWIGGKANLENWQRTNYAFGFGTMGACCAEMDIWEANSMSYALTAHPCETPGYHTCETDECGGPYSDDHYAGDCDTDGCDLNPFRHSNTKFYGHGDNVDTTRRFTVVTQFHGSGENLESVSQYFIQDGYKVEVPKSKYVDGGDAITQEFCDASKELFKVNAKFSEVGGLKAMGSATGNPMALVLSFMNDPNGQRMRWLDSEQYPEDRDASEPGVARGPCGHDENGDLMSASLTLSNFKFGPIGSTYDL